MDYIPDFEIQKVCYSKAFIFRPNPPYFLHNEPYDIFLIINETNKQRKFGYHSPLPGI